jgi:Second Messenger Oligonucleotide or Dinucleotide Synthetase domain
VAVKTVSAGFVEFQAKITPTQAQKETMAQRRSTVESVLRDAFDASNMPVVKTKLIGSAGRNTIIRPIDDIDVFAVFDDTNVWHQYQFDASNLLYRVRDALNRRYSADVGARGQAVRLFFKSAPHVEIVPAFAATGGGYVISSGRSGGVLSRGVTWQMTDPYAQEEFFSRRNTELGGYLKVLTRLLKRWNAVHSKRFSSFHLETVVQATFATLGSNMRKAVMHFFEWAPNYLSVQDPAGYSGNLNTLTWAQQQDLLHALKSGHGRASRALEAEDRGGHLEAIKLWGIILGNEFPIYG